MPTILIVHPEADAWPVPDGVDATVAPTATEARAYLAGTAFDAVYVGEGVEGTAGIAALRDVLGLSTPVETVAGPEALAERLAGGGDPAGTLAEIRDELGRVAHALNNPLAVIAGNAQLAVEMSRAVPVDETVADALRAIQEAAGELEALFADVAALRARVDRAIGPQG